MVEEYYEKFKGLLNLLQLPDDYSLSIFVSNLTPNLSKWIRLFHLKTLNHALNLTKQMEMLLYNLPKKPFIPYKSSIPNTPPYYSPHTQAKP